VRLAAVLSGNPALFVLSALVVATLPIGSHSRAEAVIEVNLGRMFSLEEQTAALDWAASRSDEELRQDHEDMAFCLDADVTALVGDLQKAEKFLVVAAEAPLPQMQVPLELIRSRIVLGADSPLRQVVALDRSGYPGLWVMVLRIRAARTMLDIRAQDRPGVSNAIHELSPTLSAGRYSQRGRGASSRDSGR
jgi:hypothetical protein